MKRAVARGTIGGMQRIDSLAQATDILQQYNSPLAKRHMHKLEHMEALMAHLGNPEKKLRVVHVAGTSGKTSTAYYAAALLKAAGHKVGLTVSPHVDGVNERVQIDLVPLDEQAFCQELELFLELVAQSDLHPNYFETLVAFALWEFVRQEVDYAVVEVGLGGLLDSTNVCRRADKLCIITDVGFDHMNILGSTLREIAAQKAGIMHAGNDAFCYLQGDEVMEQIHLRAQAERARVHVIDPGLIVSEAAALPLFQQRNFGLSVAAINFLLERDGQATLSSGQLQEAAAVRIPARMEAFAVQGKTVIIDGSHNAQKLHALIRSLRARYPEQPIAALVSFAAHGDYRVESAVAELATVCDDVIVTSFAGAQDGPVHSVEPETVVRACRDAGIARAVVISDPAEAWAALLNHPQPILLVAGSFYLLNHIRPLIPTD